MNDQECRSIESMDKDEWKTEEYNLTKIGEQIWECDPGRKYVFYSDSMGRIWYRTFIHTQFGWISQEMAIFGKRIKKRPV